MMAQRRRISVLSKVVVAKANDHTEPTFIASLNGLSGFVLEVEPRDHPSRALPDSARGFQSHSLDAF
jgi:hypothetical protein